MNYLYTDTEVTGLCYVRKAAPAPDKMQTVMNTTVPTTSPTMFIALAVREADSASS